MDISHIMVGVLTGAALFLLVWVEWKSRRAAVRQKEADTIQNDGND